MRGRPFICLDSKPLFSRPRGKEGKYGQELRKLCLGAVQPQRGHPGNRGEGAVRSWGQRSELRK